MLGRSTRRHSDELAQKEGNTLTKFTRREEVMRDRWKQLTQRGTHTEGQEVR